MTPWKVEITATAEADLTDAALYIKDVLGSPQAALKLVDEFEGCIDRLSLNPSFRPLVHDERLALRGYRWAPVGGYMAFYTMDESSRTVYIERLLYGRSDWRAVL